MSNIAFENIRLLRTELNALRGNVVENESSVQLNFKDLIESFQQLLIERDYKERQIVQRLTADHELEITEHKRVLEQNDAEINRLKEERRELEDSLKKSSEEKETLQAELKKITEEYDRKVEELENRVKEVVEEKEKAVKESKDQLIESHKAEMESIRSRFKLMMADRSPSESSLEKVDLKEDARFTKTELEEAVAQENKKWLRRMHDLQATHETSLETIKTELMDEKEKSIVLLQERVSSLMLECMKYKGTIQQLAESDAAYQNAELLQKIEVLEKEKSDLMAELEAFKQPQQEQQQQLQQQQEMAASVAVVEGRLDMFFSLLESLIKFICPNGQI